MSKLILDSKSHHRAGLSPINRVLAADLHFSKNVKIVREGFPSAEYISSTICTLYTSASDIDGQQGGAARGWSGWASVS